MPDEYIALEEYLRRPYARVLVPQAEGGFSARMLEFPGCFAEGETVSDAYQALEDAAESWLRSCVAQRLPIPSPEDCYE